MAGVREFFISLFPLSLARYADQIIARCEEPAWSFVEARAMWLSPRELKGYARARTRLLVEDAVHALSDYRNVASLQHQLRELVADGLVRRIQARAAMLVQDRVNRRAA